jgi:hypothetical protein
MANNFSSNVVQDLARVFLEKFESSRVLCKAVDTQLIQGRFTPRTGGSVAVKRPTDYVADRTPDGNITGRAKSDIQTGKAIATVQDYITVSTEWENIEEALEADQIEEILAPMATRAVTTLEKSLADYMRVNANLSVGVAGNAVTAWGDVAYAGALAESIGVPMDENMRYIMNPFTATSLANAQNGLNTGENLVKSAWERAKISDNFGGLSVMSSNALSTVADDATLVDRAGTIAGTPVATYLAAKDSMTQVIGVAGFTANATIVAGSVVEVSGKYYLNQSTRGAFIDQTGSQVKFRAVVLADVVLSGTGTGDLVIAGSAINEANGQYNTISSALADGDVITVLGAAGYVAQPNLFFHKQAFGMATVKLPKLYSTDTIATTEDGYSLRVSKYSDGDANTQKVRFDILPAFVTFNPFFAGLGYGQPA